MEYPLHEAVEHTGATGCTSKHFMHIISWVACLFTPHVKTIGKLAKIVFDQNLSGKLECTYAVSRGNNLTATLPDRRAKFVSKNLTPKYNKYRIISYFSIY